MDVNFKLFVFLFIKIINIIFFNFLIHHEKFILIKYFCEMSKENEKLKNYILLKTIGKGTFGKVKLAKHIPTKEEVAIKILEKSKINDDEELKRVNKEIKYLKHLNHPNIVHLYEIVETQNNYYIVMEYISGGELFNYIVKNKRLTELESSFFFNQIINGLEEIHKYHICHRDLKPENLLLTSDNKIIKIIDFGLSNEYIDYLNTPCGSPCYAAPEMIKGRKYNGLSIDIWACGIILFAMVYGFLPFDDKDNEKLFNKILKCNLVFPPNDKIYVSNECKDLIKRIIKLNPKERISLEDIKKHPFITKYNNNLSFDNYLYSEKNLIDDKTIIEYMEKILKINNSGKIIQKYIKNNNHNNITTTFKLLVKKYLKEKYNHRINKFEIQKKENSRNQNKLLRYTEKCEIDKNKLNVTSTSIHSNHSSVKDLNLDNNKQKDDLLILINPKLIPSPLMKPIYNKLIPINEENKNKNRNRKIDTSVSLDKKRDKSKSNSPTKQKSSKSSISTQISNDTNKDVVNMNEQKNNIKKKKKNININNNNKNQNYNGEINVVSINIYNKNKITKKIDKRVISADTKKNNKRNITPIQRMKTPIKIRNDFKISPIKIQKTKTNDKHSRDKVLRTENNNNININLKKHKNIYNDLNITTSSKNSEQNSNVLTSNKNSNKNSEQGSNILNSSKNSNKNSEQGSNILTSSKNSNKNSEQDYILTSNKNSNKNSEKDSNILTSNKNSSKNSEQDSNKNSSKINTSNFIKNNKVDKNKFQCTLDYNNKNVNNNNLKKLHNNYIPISQREKNNKTIFGNKRETLNQTLKFKEKMKINSVRNTTQYNLFDSNKFYISMQTKNSFEIIKNLISNFCEEKNFDLKIKNIALNKYIIEFDKEYKFGIEIIKGENTNVINFYILEGNEMNIKEFIIQIINRESLYK